MEGSNVNIFVLTNAKSLYISPLATMNRNEKSELVYVWGEILLRNMVFAHH